MTLNCIQGRGWGFFSGVLGVWGVTPLLLLNPDPRWHGEIITDSCDFGGARGVMVIVVGNGHGDTSSNSGKGWLHFT